MVADLYSPMRLLNFGVTHPFWDFHISVHSYPPVIKHSNGKSIIYRWLLGAIPTPLKNMSQLGLFFPIYGTIKFMFQTTHQNDFPIQPSIIIHYGIPQPPWLPEAPHFAGLNQPSPIQRATSAADIPRARSIAGPSSPGRHPSSSANHILGASIWANYNISLTWIKPIWGWFPLLTMISSEVSVRSL